MLFSNRWMQTAASSLLLLGLLATGNLQAQTTDSLRQSEQPPAKVKFYNVYASTGGIVGGRTPYMLSFEGVVQLKGRSFLALRAGFGYWRPEWSNIRYGNYDSFSLPLSASYLLTNRKFRSAGEFGLMYSFARRMVAESFIGSTPTQFADVLYHSLQAVLGYRYQRPTGGFFFKFSLGFNLLGLQGYFNSIDPLINNGEFVNRGITSNATSKDVFGSAELSVGWSIRAKRK